MAIFLDGIAVQFYRGIGPETQYIAPFSRVNFFIGANNAGKSILLNLMAHKLAQFVSGGSPKQPEGPDAYRGGTTGQFLMAVGRKLETVIDIVDKEFSHRSFQSRTGRYDGTESPVVIETRKILDRPNTQIFREGS